MKNKLRSFARRLAGTRYFGRFIRIAIAVVRLPQDRDRQNIFENQQLPALLDAISESNARLKTSSVSNLVRSVPLALRDLYRRIKSVEDRQDIPSLNIKALQDQVDVLSRTVAELQRRIDSSDENVVNDSGRPVNKGQSS